MDDDDFSSLARDFGIRPQGKSAPMAKRSSSKPSWSSTLPPNPHDAAPFSNPTFDAPPPPSRGSTDFADDSVFHASKNDPAKSSSSALPVYDKPVYDDDIFEGVPGMKSASDVNFDDVFASNYSSSPYDDLLGGFTKGAADRKAASGKSDPVRQSSSGFDGLIPGFRGSSGGGKSR